MDILLAGGTSSIMNAVINKLNKEGHRIYVLTGSAYTTKKYKNVFEQYNFAYENECIKEVLESVNPDVVLFMGAYDSNYDWSQTRKESVRFAAGLMNLLIAFSLLKHGRFIFLSSEAVYNDSYRNDIREEEPVTARSFQALTLAQGEETCRNYKQNMNLDIVILRLDQLYSIPSKKQEVTNIVARMCVEAVRTGKIHPNARHSFSMLYVSDAAEFIYKMIVTQEHQYDTYNISSAEVTNEQEIAEWIAAAMGNGIEIEEQSVGEEFRQVLSNQRFQEEFGLRIFRHMNEIVPQMASYIKRHVKNFMEAEDDGAGFWGRFSQKFRSIFLALIPFAENMVCFIPFFMLNNRAVGSTYFANLDFYLLYVLLFAIVYGQQQATFSAVLAVAGYCFRQAYSRTSLDVMLDYNTYVWIAQLFILGLVVGYMKDKLKAVKGEGDHEIDYLEGQLGDIADINLTNVRMKNVLETQIVNQNDSFGKIYEITSSLEQYEPEEVLFYAAEVLAKLMNTKDVAIYTVANRSYARLFSATSPKARELGNSLAYTEQEEVYKELAVHKVYINKSMNEQYPLMANAIYSENEMQLILMVWGIPWERMTLGQANMLTVIGYLIQNAVVRANRYLAVLENSRYIAGTNILEPEAFTKLVKAYTGARKKGLTECTILQVQVEKEQSQEAGVHLSKLLRQSDYMGRLTDGNLYALLSNTDSKDAEFVRKRFEEVGYTVSVKEEVQL